MCLSFSIQFFNSVFNLFSYFPMKVHCKNTNIVHNLNKIYNQHNGEKRKVNINIINITVQHCPTLAKGSIHVTMECHDVLPNISLSRMSVYA